MNRFWKTATAGLAFAAVAVAASVVTAAVRENRDERPEDAFARHRAALDALARAKGLAEKPGASAPAGGNRRETPAAKKPPPADLPLVAFRDPKGNFTMQLPKGWAVSSGGFDMLHWIHACDPKRPELGVFTLLKTECLLMNRASKQFYWEKRGFGLYAMFADMVVVEKVEDLYAQFMPFCAFAAKWEKSYQGFAFPQIADFELVEKKQARTMLSGVALDDAVLRGTFTDPLTKRRGEGLFTGTLCRGIAMGNVGCNIMYNVSGVTAPAGEFGDHAATLAKIVGSIRYSDAFEATAMKDMQIKAAGNARLAQTMRETSELVTRGWEERQKGFDARVGKRADATMGYERVVEKNSGKVYRAYNGFLDGSDARKRFEAASDEAYSRPLSGYIEK